MIYPLEITKNERKYWLSNMYSHFGLYRHDTNTGACWYECFDLFDLGYIKKNPEKVHNIKPENVIIDRRNKKWQ